MLAIMLLCSFFIQLSASESRAISAEDLLDGLGRRLHGEASLKCRSLSPAPTTHLITVIAPKDFIVIDGKASATSSDVCSTFQVYDPAGAIMRGGQFTPSLYKKGQRLETTSGVDIYRPSGGTRDVGIYGYKDRRVCLKLWPEAPGIEVAARQFFEAFAPSDDAVPLPNSAVLMLNNNVLLASEFIEGMQLREFLELRQSNPEHYVLDLASFQRLVMFCMLANPEDCRLENCLVRQKPDRSWEIVLIDNERSLGKEFVDGDVESRIHCVPFCFYDMLMQPLAPEIRASLHVTNRMQMLPRLQVILNEHRYHLELRTRLNEADKRKTILGIPLGEGFISNLTAKWRKFTSSIIFTEEPKETFAELLREVMPEVAAIYLDDPIRDNVLAQIMKVDAGRNSHGTPPSAYVTLQDYFFSDRLPSIGTLLRLFSGISREYGARFAPETVTELGGLMSILAGIGRSRFTI